MADYKLFAGPGEYTLTGTPAALGYVGAVQAFHFTDCEDTDNLAVGTFGRITDFYATGTGTDNFAIGAIGRLLSVCGASGGNFNYPVFRRNRRG